MDIGPIWRAMLRNKSGFVLIALQIAVTLTIMVNAIGIIQERAGNISRDSGMDEANTFALVSVVFADYEREQHKVLIEEDLDLIRNVPGVINAIDTNSFPLRQGGWSMSLALEPGNRTPDSVGSAIYFVDEHGVETFDVELIEGKNFAPEQITWDDPEDNTWPAYGIITEALARDLWPDEPGSYVGKTLYINDDDPVSIVGVIDRLQAPWQGWSGVEKSMLVPQQRASSFARYVIRTEPGMRDRLMPEIEALLAASNKDRIIRDVVTMDQTRKLAYVGDVALIKILTFVVVLLTIITTLGIIGLASFNVSRRTRQIGIRRALGATRPAIVRYFLIENSIVSAIGLCIGGALAIGLNMLLVESFSLEPLNWYVIPAGMLALWFIGQLAVAGPARRASNITPAIATRSG
ncbi:MAG: FtsX-like permease family protein [Gammaproteobacteria bacterium]|nr:FtsX-like permease family protein [Gammaproteobacteria bacterium]